MTIEIIEKYVKYNEKHGVLICITHGHSLTPGEGIGRHFQLYHQSTSIETRTKIIEYATTLPLANPKDMKHPDPDDGPIEGLELEKNGFYCIYENCNGYFSAKETTMMKHCKITHDWNSKEGPMWREQAVQTFFSGIFLSYHFNI